MAISRKEIWWDFVKGYCNNTFGGVSFDDAPPRVKLAVEILIEANANRTTGVKSKTVNGIVTESYTKEEIPMTVKNILHGYKAMAGTIAEEDIVEEE